MWPGYLWIPGMLALHPERVRRALRLYYCPLECPAVCQDSHDASCGTSVREQTRVCVKVTTVQGVSAGWNRQCVHEYKQIKRHSVYYSD